MPRRAVTTVLHASISLSGLPRRRRPWLLWARRIPAKPGYGPWELSVDRANAVRQILQHEGIPAAHMFMVAGRADTLPLFPEDPFIAANRRVTITPMREEPPLPPGFSP